MSRLVGLVGLSGSGKDEVGRYLTERHNFTRLAFADPLKEGAAVLFGLSRVQLWGDLRNTEDARWDLTPRQIYQLLGDALRAIHPQALVIGPVERCEALLQEGKSVVVTDVRMLVEAEALRNMGGAIWRVRRNHARTFAGAGHATEEESERIDEDFLLNNLGSLSDLRGAIDELVSDGLRLPQLAAPSPRLPSTPHSPTAAPTPAAAASPASTRS
jgi:hypothetical protein